MIKTTTRNTKHISRLTDTNPVLIKRPDPRLHVCMDRVIGHLFLPHTALGLVLVWFTCWTAH